MFYVSVKSSSLKTIALIAAVAVLATIGGVYAEKEQKHPRFKHERNRL